MAAATMVFVNELRKTHVARLYPFAEFNAGPNALDNSGVQDIFTLNVEGLKRICVRLTNATNALAAFNIKAYFATEDTTAVVLFSTSADFVAPKGLLVAASGDLTTLAVGSGWFIMDVGGISKLVLSANSSAAGGSSLSVNAGGM